MQLAFWSAALVVGIASGVTLAPAVSCSIGGLAIVLVLPLAWRRAWNLGLVALALASGIGLGYRESALAREPAHVEEDKPCEIEGQVVRGSDVALEPAAPVDVPSGEDGKLGHSESGRSHLRVEVETVDGKRVDATLSLLVLGGVPHVAPGDWIHLRSRLYLPRGFANPGLPDARLLARGQGIDLFATVSAPSDLVLMPGRPSLLSYARRWAFHLRQVMSRAINRRLSEPAAGFVRTMVVGERTEVPARVEDGFRAAGATHVLSVSGLHLAVVVALVFGFLKRLVDCFPSLALRIQPRVLASALALPACVLYTLLTGEAVATVRSAVMASMVLVATIINRPLSLTASIAAAAMILLVNSPLALLDVSFQLSFVSVIGLMLFAHRLLPGNSARKVRWRSRALSWVAGSFSASFAACLLTMPLVAHHFGEITPAAPIGNLVLVPIVELAVLPCGLVGSLLALAHPWLGAVPLHAAGLASHLALALADGFRQFAPVLLVRLPNGCETVLLLAAAGCFLQVLARGARRRARWCVAGGGTLLLAATSLLAREEMRRAQSDLRVTFLDVGQGDSALVEGPGGFAVLVDGGGRYDQRLDTGARVVEPVLRARGITKLDLVVLSHAHPDHMNGLLRVLERFPVGVLWTNGDDARNPGYRELLAVAERRHVSTPVPMMLSREGIVVEALGPRVDERIGVPPGLGPNDASLVIRVSFAGRRVLFPGDIGDEGESELLDRRASGLDIACDILKVPHHGSRHASSSRFLHAVSPKLAIASAGRFNRFGLPSAATLDRYQQRGIQVLRTDRDGAVTVTVDAMGTLHTTCATGCHP